MHELGWFILSILAITILVKLNNLKRTLRRLSGIEDRLFEVQRELRKLAAGAGSPPPAAPPVPPAASPVPHPAAPPLAQQPAAPPPVPVAAPRPASPAGSTRPVTPGPQARPRSAVAQAAADILGRIWQWILVGEEYRPRGVSMEYAVGTTWLMRVGIVAVVAGVGYFLKWSIDHDLLGPAARVAMSTAFGIGMLTAGMRLLGRRWHILGQGFAGGGLATLYFSMYALGPRYHLLDSPAAVFGLMILITVTAGILALASDSMLVAIFGIIGGFSTPLLLRTGEPQFAALYAYLALLNLGVLGIGHLRQWRLLNYLSFAFSYALYFAASPSRYAPTDVPVALGFLILVFVTHSTLVFVYNLRRGIPATVLEIVHLILNAGLFASAAYDLIRDAAGRPYPALMTLALAAYYVLHVAVFLTRRLTDRPLLIALISLAGFFTTLTMPLVMEQESLTIAWALQAFMFLWLGRRLDSAFLRQVAYAVYALTLFRLAVFEFHRFDFAPAARMPLAAYGHALAARLWTFGIAIASVAAGFYVELRQSVRPAQSPAVPVPDVPDLAPASVTRRVFFWGSVAIVFLYLHSEGYTLLSYFAPWRPAFLTLLWCLAAAGFLALYRSAGTPSFLAGLLFFAGGAMVKSLVFDLPGWHLCERGYFDMAYTPFFALMRWLDFAAILALFLAAAGWLRRERSGSVPPSAFGYTALALFWLYLTLEVNSLLFWKLREFQAGGVSVLWTLFALGFVTGGIWRGVRALRLTGLALFAAVVVKILFADLAHMPTVYRFGALMAIGILLLLGSFVYLRASRRFMKEDPS